MENIKTLGTWYMENALFVNYIVFVAISFIMTHKYFKERRKVIILFNGVDDIATIGKEALKECIKLRDTLSDVREKRDATYNRHRNKISEQKKQLLVYRLADMSWTGGVKKENFDKSLTEFRKMKVSELLKAEQEFYNLGVKDSTSAQKYANRGNEALKGITKTKKDLKKSKK